uniref:Signal recognition particle 19 kDa protein n=1 Tax=Xiphophorus couchianus TaxID=32473 RepID=A0A3B5M597_9TELE
MAHLTENPADKERFICVYPIYINSKKTLAEGRRIPTEKAVENPSCAEVRDVLTAAGMNVYVENKMHPREWNRDVQFRGRVRVQLKQTDGSLCQDKFRSRKFPAGGASPALVRTQEGSAAVLDGINPEWGQSNASSAAA